MAERKIEPRPVQVFLDTKKFIALEEPTDFGGSNKDFYKDNDRGFAEQKQRIRHTLTSISGGMRATRKPAGFMRVQMREDAFGKSYRPLGSLFTRSHGFAHVGGGRIGEMIFQATPQALERLGEIIEERAELTPRIVINKKTDLPEPRVSNYRSEVGAIAEMVLHDKLDRVSFSAADATEWFRNGNTLGGYLVELFRPMATQAPEAVRTLVSELRRALEQVPGGIFVRPFLSLDDTSRFGDPPLAITVQLLADSSTHLVDLPFGATGTPAMQATEQGRVRTPLGALNLNEADHQAFLDLLSEQALVRSVELPPIVEAAPASVAASTVSPSLPAPTGSTIYPVVGIIDGGVASIPALRPWCIGDAGLIPLQDRDERHGTFIAGLVAGAYMLNPHAATYFEPSGCKFYDLDLFPKRELRQTYYGGDVDYLFDVLEEKIKIAKAQHNVRIFNFSFGLRVLGQRFGYSHYADRFDRIARTNDVILVISAGNLPQGGGRPTWPANHVEAVTMLAGFGADQRISQPAEHLLGVTVGAVNPPGMRGHEAHLPTTYTRRGPGVGGARKPDLCHIGGVEASAASGNRTGLTSFAVNGDCVENCGTSFASPSVAATIATLDQRLEYSQPRELLMALPVHRARRAKPLTHSSLRHVSRDFVGFGHAPVADTLLLDNPYAITLVFSDTLLRKQKLEFPFTWPAALVTVNGSCRGNIELTLAYTPPIDPDHKDEAQRVELEAFIHQEDIDPVTGEATWISRLMQDGSGVPPGMNKTERYMLATGLKWTPIKRFYANMPQGRGNNSNWRLSLSSLTRAGATYPDTGVPFCLILTLSDPNLTTPIHDNVRNTLINQGLNVADILVAHRVRPRK